MTEHLPRVDAVDSGGLANALRNPLQPGDKDDKVVADILPEVGNDHGQQRHGYAKHNQALIARPIDRDQPAKDRREKAIDEAALGMKDVAPHNGDADRRGKDRQKEDRAKHGLEAAIDAFDQYRKRQRDGQIQRDNQKRKEQRRFQAIVKLTDGERSIVRKS